MQNIDDEEESDDYVTPWEEKRNLFEARRKDNKARKRRRLFKRVRRLEKAFSEVDELLKALKDVYGLLKKKGLFDENG